MKYVYHVDDEIVSDKLDHTMIVVPPKRAVRIMNDFYAEIFMQHKARIHGIVYVDELDTGEGTKLDIESAKVAAAAALDEAERICIGEYVETQRQDRMRLNFPAMPPAGRTAKVIAKRGIDLLAMGIKPIGYEVDRQLAASGNEALADEIADLRKKLAEAMELLAVAVEERKTA